MPSTSPPTGPPERLQLTPHVEEQAYRIALEAVHNAVKHAAAGAIRVGVADLDDGVGVIVTDDRRGFDPTVARPGHRGLTSMQERAAQVGADLHICTVTESGSSIRLTLPGRLTDS
jgi:signal transduction histidine kinase